MNDNFKLHNQKHSINLGSMSTNKLQITFSPLQVAEAVKPHWAINTDTVRLPGSKAVVGSLRRSTRKEHVVVGYGIQLSVVWYKCIKEPNFYQSTHSEKLKTLTGSNLIQLSAKKTLKENHTRPMLPKCPRTQK